MAKRLFTSALFAGLTAGLIAALLQFFLMEPLILQAEMYESGEVVHFAGVPGISDDHHAGDQTAQDHAHSAKTTGTEDGLTTRFGLAFFTDFIVFVGWGLMMVAGFALAEIYGRRVSVTAGLLWGGAGFVAVQLAPGVGLPPELPGTPAADLQARQIWWIATALLSAGAMALFAYGQSVGFVLLGSALLVLPHLIGAPHLDTFSGLAPPELASEFVARSFAVSMAAWITLGLAAGYFWNRSPDIAG